GCGCLAGHRASCPRDLVAVDRPKERCRCSISPWAVLPWTPPARVRPAASPARSGLPGRAGPDGSWHPVGGAWAGPLKGKQQGKVRFILRSCSREHKQVGCHTAAGTADRATIHRVPRRQERVQVAELLVSALAVIQGKPCVQYNVHSV